jgi:predicted negative regulator of RcsB-dependent stress response
VRDLERRALESLSTQARDAGLRDLAILRLAGLKADQGSLKEAIDLARKTDSRGELSEHRARLLETWQQALKTKKTR